MKILKNIFFIVFFSAIVFSTKGQVLNKEDLVKGDNISIVDRTGISILDSNPIAFGKRELINAIVNSGGSIQEAPYWSKATKKVYIILGTLDNTVVRRLVLDEPEIISNKSEGVFYQWRNTQNGMALVIGGTDSIGLMYALCELSQQINNEGLIALTKIENTIEFPDNTVRGLDKFIKDQHDDSWFFSETYWQYYIQQLAKNRFNRLTLITGYNDGSKPDFMMPVYPYLVKVPGFEDIKLGRNIVKTQEQYLTQLKRIGEISHDYGLEFVFGVWSHGRNDTLITGLTHDPIQYTTYCSHGMRELLRQVPEIDGIQLRVNYESGVGGFGDTAENFWKEIITAVGDIYKERKGKLFLDIRAKGITEKIRNWALETGINVHITSKYSWEGVGLPYHPIEMRKGELDNLGNVDLRQRYGYADFLYKSRDFDYINRLWGIGTIRMFTWADPDYVKRFSNSTSFGGSKGFQVTPPLARKKNTWNLFSDESLIYYNWEDQRYWAWYELFGRLGYSKETKPEVWQRTFRQHYGISYQAVLDAYAAAGKVLPLITSSHLTYHPANYNWAEMDSGGALFVSNNASSFHKRKERTYQSAEPGDPGMFYSINDYVKDVLNDDVKSKINPVQLSALYKKLSNETLEALSKVKKEAIPELFKKEYLTNEIDLKITAALSLYHSYKIKAATDFVFYQETQKKAYLNASLANMKMALAKWREIAEFTEKIYSETPLFLTDNGTWKDRLEEIEKDIDTLTEMMGDSDTKTSLSHWDTIKQSDLSIKNTFEAIVPKTARTKETLKLTLITGALLDGKQTPKVHYRIANMAAGKFKQLNMTWDGTNYIAEIPVDYLNTEFDLLVYFTSMTHEGHVTMHPGLFHKTHEAPYYVVEITK